MVEVSGCKGVRTLEVIVSVWSKCKKGVVYMRGGIGVVVVRGYMLCSVYVYSFRSCVYGVFACPPKLLSSAAIQVFAFVFLHNRRRSGSTASAAVVSAATVVAALQTTVAAVATAKTTMVARPFIGRLSSVGELGRLLRKAIGTSVDGRTGDGQRR